MADEDEVDIVGEFSDDSPSAGTYDEMALTMNELLPYLGSNSWLLNTDQVWCMESTTETKPSVENYKGASTVASKRQTNRSTESKVTSVTHNKPWTNVEKQLFQKGLELYGNSWPQVAKYVGTRTTLQVKNFGRRYLIQVRNAESDLLSTVADVEASSVGSEIDNESENPAISRRQRPKNRKLAFDDDGFNSGHSKTDNVYMKNSPDVIRLRKRLDSSESEDVDVDVENLVDGHPCNVDEHSRASPSDIAPMTGEVKIAHVDRAEYSEDDDDQRFSESSETEFEEERVFTFVKPETELMLERNVILEEENVVHQEFFEGRPQKTPERYLKIRNYILDSWARIRPTYLNKTSVRPGLKNCGDVNCIGRIHAYLEQTGAINFGCDQTVYNRPLVLVGKPTNAPRTKKSSCQTVTVSNHITRTDAIRRRKRRAPVLTFDSTAGGYTITHDESGQIVDISDAGEGLATTSKRSKNAKIVVSSNPFRLIQCSEFSPDDAPFAVCVDVKALILMDIHAHLSHLEVIGLLGGHYDNNSAVLNVITAEPCESLTSTGSECEMDPVSQTQASERLQRSGLNVVGWYHSHPSFSPNPSLRDLETQAKFQEWFGQGGSPFLGVIVSPHHSTSSASNVRYLMVGDESVQPDNHRKPYKFSPNFTALGPDLTGFMSDVERLISKWIPSIIRSADASQSTLSIMNKLISSVHHHLIVTQEDQSNVLPFLCAIGNIIVSQMPINPTSCDQDQGECHQTGFGGDSPTVHDQSAKTNQANAFSSSHDVC